MPRQNIDYTKTIIYKIVCNDDNFDYLYIGSTTNFTKRKNNHKSCCNNQNNKDFNQKKYVQMRQNGGWTNFKMIEIEKYPCNDKREAEAREEELRIDLKANMNIRRCFTTIEQKKAYQEEYYNDNKEKIKEYYNDNKEKVIEKAKEYYNDNKNKIKEKKNLKCVCSCGGKFTNANKATHSKTTKHHFFLENN